MIARGLYQSIIIIKNKYHEAFCPSTGYNSHATDRNRWIALLEVECTDFEYSSRNVMLLRTTQLNNKIQHTQSQMQTGMDGKMKTLTMLYLSNPGYMSVVPGVVVH